jgi:voltage-gated potassium channel Kch
MALREGTTTVDAGLGPVPVALPEDATTLARASLTRLPAKMRTKLLTKVVLDATTRAHLQESLARINQALTASMQRKVD